MADEEEFEGDVADDDEVDTVTNTNYSHNTSDDRDSDKRSRESDRHRRNQDSDRSKDDSSRHRRRSRSRSRSRERNSSNRSGREGSRNGDRRRTRDEDNASGSSRRSDNYEYEEGRGQGRRDKRDDDSHTHSSGTERISGHDWRTKLTSIRDAHFNRSKKAPTSVQNQFKNDGSFLEMFRKKMAEQTAKGEDKSSLTPNSLVLASSSIPFSPHLSLPPLTTALLDVKKSSSSGGIDPEEDLDGVPMPTHRSLPVPVSVGKRRLAKPLKTGIVLKKPQEPEEDEASQEKLDAWSRYLQEVQKYKSSNCMDEDNSRPLVK